MVACPFIQKKYINVCIEILDLIVIPFYLNSKSRDLDGRGVSLFINLIRDFTFGQISMKFQPNIVTVLVIVLALSALSFAANHNISACGPVTFVSGDTYDVNQSLSLTNNGVPVTGGTYACIWIDNANVTLDCHGYSITNLNGSITPIGIFIANSSLNMKNITVKNCPSITGFVDGTGSSGDGLYAESVNQSNFSGVGVQDSFYGIFLQTTNNTVIKNSQATGNDRDGLYTFDSGHNSIDNFTAHDNGDNGIFLDGSEVGSANLYNNVTNSYAYNNGNNGINLDHSSQSYIANSFAYNNSLQGFLLQYSVSSNNVFFNNTGRNNSQNGFEALGGDFENFTQNTAYGNQADGFYFSSTRNTTIYNNTAYLNNLTGIDLYISNQNNLTLNTAYLNNDSGIILTDAISNNITGNLAYNNTNGISVLSSVYDYIFNNTVANNTADGFVTGAYSTGPTPGPFSSDNMFVLNNATRNSNYGFDIIGGTNNTLLGNYVLAKSVGIGLSNVSQDNVTSNSVFLMPSISLEIGFLVSNSSSSSLYDNLVNGNQRDFEVGFVIQTHSNDTRLVRNNATNNYVGIGLGGASNTTVRLNYIINNTYAGFFMSGADDTVLMNVIFSNNTNDFSLNDSGVSSGYNLTIATSYFTDPYGLFATYTNLSLYDSNLSNEVFNITWAANSNPVDPRYSVLNQKIVKITNLSNVNIDSIVWGWNDSEVASLNESKLFLAKYNGSAWNYTLNNTPNTAADTLSLYNVTSFSDYAILDNESANCPIISTSGTYTQPMNYIGAPNPATPQSNGTCVKIITSNVVFDCNGFNITNNGTFLYPDNALGIQLNGSLTNVTVKNCRVSGYSAGIYVYNSSGNQLINNTEFNNSEGVHISFSYSDNVSSNTAYNNSAGIDINGSSQNILVRDSKAYNNSAGFYLTGTSNNQFVNNSAYNNTHGFQLSDTASCLFENNTALTNTLNGFHLVGSSYNNFTTNNATGNLYDGFYLIASSNSSRFNGNNASNNHNNGFESSASYETYIGNIAINNTFNGFAIFANSSNLSDNSAWNNPQSCFYLSSGASFNNLTRNNATKCSSGFKVESTTNTNILVLNRAVNNTIYGFWLISASKQIVDSDYAYNNSYGFMSSTGSSNNFTNNNAYLNQYGFYSSSTSNNLFRYNNAFNSTQEGFHLGSLANNCVLEYNNATNSTLNGYFLFASSGCNLTGNNAFNNTNGFSLDGGSGNNKIASCHSNSNSQYGFVIIFGSGNTIDSSTAYYNNNQAYRLEYPSNNITNSVGFRNGNGVFVDAGGSSNIWLVNNTMDNATAGGGSFGFRVDSSSGVTFINNRASNNSGYGYLLNSGSNVLQGNNASFGTLYGFYLSASDQNNLSNNLAFNNTDDGFDLHSSSGNNLTGNKAYNNTIDGFYLIGSTNNIYGSNAAYNNSNNGFVVDFGSEYNNFTSNTADTNKQNGFQLVEADNNRLTGNNATGNLNNGFHLDKSTYNNLTSNTALNNIFNGFFIAYPSDNNYLYGNNALLNTLIGFYVQGSNQVNMTANTAHDNGNHGFFLNQSSFCNITSNTAYNNGGDGFGLYFGSNNNILRNNTAYGNTGAFNPAFGSDGFWLGGTAGSSDNNLLIDNMAFGNNNSGLSVTLSFNNTLINNTAHDQLNYYGFFIPNGSGNTLINNTAYGNPGPGFVLQSTADTNMSGNTAYNNPAGGVFVQNSDNTRMVGDHLYNNYPDFKLSGGSSALYLTNVIFDNPVGGVFNFTNLSLYDSALSGEIYTISWASLPSPLGSDYFSFRNKFVNITNYSSVSIDSIVWSWLPSGVTFPPYNESHFILAKYNGVAWDYTLNRTPDISNHVLSLANVNTFSDYAILQYDYPNISLAKTVSPGTIQINNNVTYHLTATNTGFTDLNLTIIDVLPLNVSFTGSTVPPTSVVGQTISWVGIATLHPGDSFDIYYNVTANASGTYTNHANATGVVIRSPTYNISAAATSSFTANNRTTPPPTGGGEENHPLAVSLDSSCDGNVVTVTSSGHTVSNARVLVEINGVQTIYYSNADGIVTFSGCDGPVNITASGSTYTPGSISNRALIACSSCPVCQTDSDCNMACSVTHYDPNCGKYQCIGGQCVPPECQNDSDCPDTERCTQNRCEPVPCPDGVVIGHKCVQCGQDSDCGSGQSCDTSTHTCSPRCQYACCADSDCLPGQTCDAATHACKCQFGCCADSDCKTDQSCNSETHACQCKFECCSDTDCPANQTCVDNRCTSGGLSGNKTGYVGTNETVRATQDGNPASGADIVITDPSGRTFKGKTGPDGSLSFPLTLSGTYKVALMQNGKPIATMTVDSLQQNLPPQPGLLALILGFLAANLLWIIILLLLILAFILYMRRRGEKAGRPRR